MITRREALAAIAATTLSDVSRGSQNTKLTLSRFTTEVTCPIGHPLMGGGVAPAKEILDPLFAHGFVIQGVGKPIAFVAVDWCEIRNGAYDAWRTAIARAIETEPVRVMVCALHQHDTPIADLEAEELLRKHGNGASICDLEFHEKTLQRIAADAKASLRNSQPITHYGQGQAVVQQVASNRRYLDEQGLVHYNRMSATRDPKIRAADDGTIDPHVKTLSFWNESTPLLALSLYATHPMSYYGRGGVTSDFVGMARKRRQADSANVVQIYASGCSGNVTAGKYNDGSPDNRPILADRLYQAMNAAWKNTKTTPIGEAQFRSVPLTLEPRTSKGFSEAELFEKLKSDPRPFGRCLAALGLSWRKRVAANRPIDVPVLDFGGAVLTVLPAESYVEYQLFAQSQRPDAMVFVAGYGECGPGYIPIERAWKENDSNLSDWCWVNPGSEQRMQNAITAALGVKKR